MAKKGEKNKSAGKPRPYTARNIARLERVKKFFSAVMKDLQRADPTDEWVATALRGATQLAGGYDELVNAFECAPSDYKPKRTAGKRAPRKARASQFTRGETVVLLPTFIEKYPEELVGSVGTKGSVVSTQPGGVLVTFAGSAIPTFVRAKHLSIAGQVGY